MSVTLLMQDNSAEQYKGKIKLSIDKIAYTSKPERAEIGNIRNRLSGKAAATEIDILTLGNVINNGQTIQGPILRDKQSDNEDTDSRFLEQQLFFIDIDNDKAIQLESGKKVKVLCENPYSTTEQIINKAAAAGLTPCFIAESFSSGKKDINGAVIPKYHVGFASAEPVTDVKQARRILFKLIDVFKGAADEACKDPARIIFGTAQSKQVYYNSAVNSIEALLNCSKAEPEESPKDPQQQPLPSSEPAPKASKGTSSEPKASGKTGIMSDFTRELKENKTDPDILLQMIHPSALSYNDWLRVSAAYKLFDGYSVEVWDNWNRQYISQKADYKADLKAFKALKGHSAGKQVTKKSLHYFAELQSPNEYNNYINALIQENTIPKTPRNKIKSKLPATADPEGTLSEGNQVNTKAEQVEQWNDIKPFEKAIDLQPFPLETLPKLLQDYVQAAAAYNSVYPEMCILSMFSALSVCLQGKATVKHPGTGHIEPLNLFCLTIAAPGERKTATSELFMKPVKDYEQWYNTIHNNEIQEYNIKHQILTNRLNKATAKASKQGDEKAALDLKAELTELEKNQKHPLNCTLQDVTPEALISALSENGERAAITGDEATIFKIIGGAYSGGKGSGGVNFDILLNSYDGSQYKVSRKGSGNIYLKAPLVTIGTMIQEQPFKQLLENSDISGKGLLQRFIFAIPRSNVGNIPFTAPQIPSKTARAYKELIYSLLEKKQLPNPATLSCDKEATHFFEYYHTELQKKMKPGGAFSDPFLQEYASKQFSKVMRIAALLHMCEHSEGETISGHTAMNAVKIGAWLEMQALAALEAQMMSSTERNARYILRKLVDYARKAPAGKLEPLKKRDITRMCRKLQGEEMQEALAYLDDMGVLRYQEEKTSGRPCMKVTLNPAITDFKF